MIRFRLVTFLSNLGSLFLLLNDLKRLIEDLNNENEANLLSVVEFIILNFTQKRVKYLESN